MNISFKVAVGFALPNEPGASYHLGQIPAGYARVGVDEIIPVCYSQPGPTYVDTTFASTFK